MSESLPDSGGAYYDADTGGVVGILKRNVGEAQARIRNGSAGGAAVGFAVGAALVPVVKWAADVTGLR